MPRGSAPRTRSSKVHSALVEAGNRLYFATHRRLWREETFESAEANRAASLRALLAEPRDWRRNLPAEYWETLRKLESAEADLLRSPGSAYRTGRRAGSPVAGRADRVGVARRLEHRRGPARSSGTHAPQPPSGRGLLRFSPGLGRRNSYLWAVSRESFALYRLPPGPEIGALVARFAKAVRQGKRRGQRRPGLNYSPCYLDSSILPSGESRDWLLALDAQLFELPFAALVEEPARRVPCSWPSVIPCRLLPAPLCSRPRPRPPLLRRSVRRRRRPRLQHGRSAVERFPASLRLLASLPRARADAGGGDLHLARLAGSAREAADCAAAWNGTRTTGYCWRAHRRPASGCRPR